MEQPDFKQIAAQLREPTGSQGIETANRMNINNGNMIRCCIDKLPLKPGIHVVEMGPGGGLHLPYLLHREQNIRYTGVDISETMVTLARENNNEIQHETANFTKASVAHGWVALPFPNQSVDIVFTVNTLYFWDDASAQAKEIHRVLKPGGTLALCFAPESFMSQLPFTQYGFTLYTSQRAAELLIQAGFEMDHIYTQTETVRTSAETTMEREFMVMMAGC